MQTKVFYTIMLAFAGGILLRSFFIISVPITLLGLVIGGGLLALWLRVRPVRSAPKLLIISLVLLAVSIGMLRFAVAEQALLDTVWHEAEGETVTLTGLVVREPEVRAKNMLVTLRVDDTRVLVSVDRNTLIAYGDVVSVTGKLKAPEPFATDLGREFDYAGYLAARGVTHTISFATLEVIEQATTLPLLPALYEFKHHFLQRLSLTLPEPYFGLGAGLLLGVQSALGDELEEAFRVTGIIHIVVLSGYNIMLVVAFVMYVLAFLLPFRSRLVVGIIAVIIFALLVGFSPSVLRASTMAIIFLLASLFARQYAILRALLLAGAIMLLINPYLLRYDIGFQLSFMATLGLILVAPQFELLLARVPATLSLRSFFIATVATQIAVAPLLLYHIGQWSLVAIPVNLLVLPMVPVAMLLTFAAGIVALISLPLALPVSYLATLSLWYIITFAQTFAALPFAAVTVPPFPGILVPIMYAALGCLFWRYWYRPAAEEKLPALPSHQDTSELSGWTVIDEETMSPTITKNTLPPRENSVPGQAESADDLPIFFR